MSTKNIHIHAVSPYFEIWKIVPEKKADKELINIRNNFMRMEARQQHEMRLSRKRASELSDGVNKLIVKTGVHNPTLF